jgi:hypothetical protein
MRGGGVRACEQNLRLHMQRARTLESNQPNAISKRGAVHVIGYTGSNETSNPLLPPCSSDLDGWVCGSTKFVPLAAEAETTEKQIE